MAKVKTYLSDEVIVTFFGVPITGRPDAEFITIAPMRERWTDQDGSDGEVMRSRSNNKRHDVSLILMQSSDSNLYLSGLAELDNKSAEGKGPLLVTDLSGTTLYFWPEAWIQQEADGNFGREGTDRTWPLRTGQAASSVVGGNN